MGEVYRARDARLHREVAIKILPDSVARDEASRARFEREAQAVAALSHPNVLAIFDIGSERGHLYVVTELLDGETLRDRLRQGPLPVRKTIDWAAGIARGLAAAHDKQVVHRDLKPENIFLTTDGRVKILDFGLAKAPVTAGTGDTAADTSAAITGDGVVLGTVGYMAPEQIRGLAVDGRADVFALGAVFFEMLTGRRAFHRETAADTMTAILQDEPPELGPARSDLPPGLERIIRHCLEKNPKERFQSAQDVAFALDTLSGAVVTGTSGPQAVPRRSPAALAGLSVGLAVLAGLLWWGAAKFGSGGPPTTPIAIGASTQVTADDGLEIDAALSPDGRLLAYSAGQARQMRIFIRPVAGGRVLTLSESETAFEYQPRWSPDGSQILFLRPEGVFVASSLGGAARQIASGSFAGAAWSPDGARVLLVRPAALSVVALAGGAEEALVTDGVALHSCAWSPSSEWIACASGNDQAVIPGRGFGNVAPSALVLAPAAGGPFVTIADRTVLNASPAWSPDGRQLYFVSSREGPRDVYVMDIGPSGASGPARRVTTGLGVQSIAFASTFGRLAYVTSVMRANIWSLPIPSGAPVDTSGAQPVTNGTQVVEAMTVSKDGRWLTFDTTLHLNAEILRLPLAGGQIERLTMHPADDFAPDLSPDGRLLAFHSWRTGSRDIFVQPLDGAAVQQLTDTPAQESYPIWSPDGRAIAFVAQEAFRREVVHGDLFLMRRGDDDRWSAPVTVAKSVATQGAWLRRGISAVLAFAREGGIVLISPDTGTEQTIHAPASGSADPRAWSVVASADSTTLYFKSGDAAGQTTFWSIPAGGGTPRLLVRFADPARQSVRPDFAVGGGRVFFTIEDRQADIWVAEVSRR
jgi:Tol biopolymer transport system component